MLHLWEENSPNEVCALNPEPVQGRARHSVRDVFEQKPLLLRSRRAEGCAPYLAVHGEAGVALSSERTRAGKKFAERRREPYPSCPCQTQRESSSPLRSFAC